MVVGEGWVDRVEGGGDKKKTEEVRGSRRKRKLKK